MTDRIQSSVKVCGYSGGNRSNGYGSRHSGRSDLGNMHFHLQGSRQRCQSKNIFYYANGMDKTNSDDREERNRASRGGVGGGKNPLELARPYLELDHMLLYCL